MIKQHFTADCVNLVINDPSVYSHVKGAATGYLDITPVVQEPNVLLMGEHGGVLFIQHSPGVYEAHTQVLPAGRGQWALDMANECLTWMFTKTDCVDIMTKIPKGNLGARAMAKNLNGRPEFRAERGWITDEGVVYADVFSWQLQSWAANAPPNQLEAEGILFHAKLEEEYKRIGKEEDQHEDDPTHNRYVGMASLMMKAGQAYKAVVFYNRWAGMAGYAPIQIASENPLVIDIHESLIAIEGDTFYVLRVK